MSSHAPLYVKAEQCQIDELPPCTKMSGSARFAKDVPEQADPSTRCVVTEYKEQDNIVGKIHRTTHYVDGRVRRQRENDVRRQTSHTIAPAALISTNR
uniref:Uncharacterized protein n=1 Tax=Citrus sinensis TaxID=2711 RepID=Q5TIK3_CITSI|nr:hypothetical protein [Citrus sinensis]